MGIFSISWGNQQLQSVERDSSGNWEYTIMNSNATHSPFGSEKAKLKAVLSNPAVLKVFALNCDLFSIGEIESGKIENFLHTKRDAPNFKQTWSQFLWDYMFWIQTGTAYLWNPNNATQLGDNNTIQWLNPANIDWNDTILKKLQALIFSKATLKDVLAGTIKYNLGNGSSIPIPLSEITPFFDLSSGMNDNYFKGASRLDSLYKIISNSEHALNAKSINLEFSQKFMINGKNSIDDVTNQMMGVDEKIGIEQSVRSNKKVHAVKSPIDINRFVDDIASLKLDECFYNDYLMIGSVYGVPKELLDANLGAKGTTYENQEKAIGRHVEYNMMPKGKNLTQGLEMKFKYKDLVMTWRKAAFNQVFEVDRQNVIALKLANLVLAKELGVKIEDI